MAGNQGLRCHSPRVLLWQVPDRLRYGKGRPALSAGGERLHPGSERHRLLPGCPHRAGRQAPSGTDPGPADRSPLRGGFCDSDGRDHRGAAQCGHSPGFRGGSGPGKGGWGESSLFALPGRQRFSGHCGSEKRIEQNATREDSIGNTGGQKRFFRLV